MGFLLLVFEDEELTFRSFCQVMDKFMKPIFANNFEMLNLYFGRFKKLIDLNLAVLSRHFKVRLASSGYIWTYYPTGWKHKPQLLLTCLVHHHILKWTAPHQALALLVKNMGHVFIGKACFGSILQCFVEWRTSVIQGIDQNSWSLQAPTHRQFRFSYAIFRRAGSEWAL